MIKTKPGDIRSRAFARMLGRGVCVAVVALSLRAAAQNPVCSRTYTLDADFETGVLLNVNHVPADQLQLNTITKPFPFVNIACSARDTVVRIDVDTGLVLGEYRSAPSGMGGNPSRTTVDRFGNVWVANRNEAGVSGGENKGSITRIAIVLGGTRCNADGTPNPLGQYLKPPYQYSTAVDRDGDGLIKTSRGLGDVLSWSNAGGADTHGGVTTAEDELIINYTRVAGANTRTIAVDANNDVWTGGLGDLDHEKIDGLTGQPIPGTKFNLGCGGYGGLIDGNGILWSARGGNSLLRYDPVTMTGVSLGFCIGNYGLGIDPNTGHIWHSDYGCDLRLHELDAAGNSVNSYPQPGYAQGVAVDSHSHVWVAEAFGNEVWHWAPDPMLPGQHVYVGSVTGLAGVTGVAVDANGKIWASEFYSSPTHGAARIDPAAGPIGGGGYAIGAVDLTVGLGNTAQPYNYSDMTGFVSIGATAPSGTWTVIHDSTTAGTAWGTLCWTADTPAGTAIKVEVRAADTQAALSSQTFIAVQNCTSFCDAGITGQFIEVRTTLSRDVSAQGSPVLYDLTVKCCNQPPVAACRNVETCNDPGLCQATVTPAQIAGDSYDPDGDPITITVVPPSPYPVGVTQVTVTVIDDQGAAASCEATVRVKDCEAPRVTCTPTTNPAGGNIPNAGTGQGANSASGRNPDGFYELLARDNCDGLNLQLWIKDSAEGPCGGTFAAGPFTPGTKVKLTQSPGKAAFKPMAGVIAAHINTKGDPILMTTDSAGNRSACRGCLLPPPPK